MPGAWYTGGGNIVNTPADAYFTIAEDEGPDDYVGIIDAIPHLNPTLPRAIITNFASYVQNGKDDKELAKPLIDAGFACITECYLGDNAMATPENMQGRANNLGWEKTQPGFGVWNKWWDDYKNWFGWWPGHWFYLAENFIR